MARSDLFDYNERLYNPRRKPSTLGCARPAEFERHFTSLGIADETREARLPVYTINRTP